LTLEHDVDSRKPNRLGFRPIGCFTRRPGHQPRGWSAFDQAVETLARENKPERLELDRKLDGASIDRAWALNDPRRFPTPQSTIEAVFDCVRERGLAALTEPANVQRLKTFDETARKQLNERIARLRGE
jgi:hypothetical protein